MKKILTIIVFIFIYSCSNNGDKVELENSDAVIQNEMLSSPSWWGGIWWWNTSSR